VTLIVWYHTVLLCMGNATRRSESNCHNTTCTKDYDLSLRVELFLNLKLTVSVPRTWGLLYSPWEPLGTPSTYNTHRSSPPVSALAYSRGRGPSHQSHVLEHRDTYGQAQVCSNGHQGSSIDRPRQLPFCWIKFWYVRNPLPQSIRLRLSFLVR